MTRFDPAVIWKSLPADALAHLVEKEADRYDIALFTMSGTDFYYDLIRFFREQHGDLQVLVPKQEGFAPFYQGMYFAAMFLLDKPGYMGVPVSRHFALEETEAFFADPDKESRVLTVPEADLLHGLRERYGSISLLTNREIEFLSAFFPQLKGQEK
jgi:hypothetical protein